MPKYGTETSPNVQVLTSNTPALVWDEETVAVGDMSKQVLLPANDHQPKSYAVELAFTDANGSPADPGAFECDVLHATTDAQGNYVKMSSITTVNASFVGRVEMPEISAKFAALQMTSLANAATVKVTASFCK